ncbi:MAG: M28 family metallopeptidase [bacterium]
MRLRPDIRYSVIRLGGTVACLIALTCACDPAPVSRAPAMLSAAIPFTAANGSNALARVAALCTLGPRDAGTPGAARTAQWLAAELQRHGLAAGIDTFTNETPAGPLVCRNVLATILPRTEGGPGAPRTGSAHDLQQSRHLPARGAHGPPVETPGGCIVLLSHFDTKSGISTNFVGANDGGSSTGLLLELARVLGSTPLRQCHVLFGFLDGEECRVQYGPRDGFHGSHRLAAQLAAGKRHIRAVILLDMVGDRDLSITLPDNGTLHLTLLALEAAKTAGVRNSFRLADRRILDDHQAFLDAGFPAVDLIDFVYGSAPGRHDYWHTPDDTLDKLSATSLTAVGQVVVEMLRQLDAR